MNNHDALVHYCESWSDYPSNLLRPKQLKSVLEGYRQNLGNNEQRLFNSTKEEMNFLELYDGSDCKPR